MNTKQKNNIPVLLASTSIYRKKLLKKIVSHFHQDAPIANEDDEKKTIHDPKYLSLILARKKCLSLKDKYPDHLIIGSDQVCHQGLTIFSKPQNPETAFQHLLLLNGKSHQLTTSISIYYKNRLFEHTDQTVLHMKKLSENFLRRYIRIDSPLDCAGSYKWEKNGFKLFQKIETEDPDSIIGLPIVALLKIIYQIKKYS